MWWCTVRKTYRFTATGCYKGFFYPDLRYLGDDTRTGAIVDNNFGIELEAEIITGGEIPFEEWLSKPNRPLTKKEQFLKALTSLPVIPRSSRNTVLTDIYIDIYMTIPVGGKSDFGSVSMYVEEDITKLDPLRDKVKLYDLLELDRYFDSLRDYLNSTKYYADIVTEYAKEKFEKKAKIEAEEASDLRDKLSIKPP